MTTFSAALHLCGLSQQEAADFFDVSKDTVKSWGAGRARPPEGVWKMLAGLFDQIQDAADAAADVMDLEGVDPRAYNNLSADIESDSLPTEGAAEAAGAMALLMVLSDRNRQT